MRYIPLHAAPERRSKEDGEGPVLRPPRADSNSAPLQPVRVLFGMGGNLAEDLLYRNLYSPVKVALGVGIVHDHPGNIVSPGLGIFRRNIGTEEGIAPER